MAAIFGFVSTIVIAEATEEAISDAEVEMVTPPTDDGTSSVWAPECVTEAINVCPSSTTSLLMLLANGVVVAVNVPATPLPPLPGDVKPGSMMVVSP